MTVYYYYYPSTDTRDCARPRRTEARSPEENAHSTRETATTKESLDMSNGARAMGVRYCNIVRWPPHTPAGRGKRFILRRNNRQPSFPPESPVTTPLSSVWLDPPKPGTSIPGRRSRIKSETAELPSAASTAVQLCGCSCWPRFWSVLSPSDSTHCSVREQPRGFARNLHKKDWSHGGDAKK